MNGGVEVDESASVKAWSTVKKKKNVYMKNWEEICGITSRK